MPTNTNDFTGGTVESYCPYCQPRCPYCGRPYYPYNPWYPQPWYPVYPIYTQPWITYCGGSNADRS